MPELFRELVEAGVVTTSYEPPQLLLIPIFLRPRATYYREAEASIRQALSHLWETFGHLYESEEAFHASGQVKHLWNSRSPLWWGLNDTVGWIDARLSVLEREFQVTLFTTTKRATRRLRDKRYVARRQEKCDIPSVGTNEELRELLCGLLDRVAGDERLKRLHVPLDGAKRLIRHVDLIGFIHEALAEHTTAAD